MRMIWEYEINDDDKEFIEKNSKSIEIKLNGNRPYFIEDYKNQLGGRDYYFSEVNERRCGVAFACIKNDTISNPYNRTNSLNKRYQIHSKPSGFPKSKEENTVNKKLIFQRCHLIGYNLYKIRNDKGEENANLKKIFTGTRFMNNVMYYYEKRIYNYVYNTENKVLYRVTPYFKESNKRDKLVFGVQMEAMFINENGNEDEDLSFNVFVYNKQPDILFEYGTGEILKDESINLIEKMSKIDRKYIINKKSKRFHLECCASVGSIDKEKMQEFCGKREELNNLEFKCYPCKICDSGTK
jgi:DNA-entry nuclease